jgi:RHS repeat-associated protein
MLFLSAGQATETITYYHNDGLGSPVAATNDEGELLWHEDYRPYGERYLNESTDVDAKWYTGKPTEDEIGLSYFGARWYDPAIGRFMAVDPVGVMPDNFHSFNRYAYANNNPYKYVDPDGNLPVFVVFVAKELITLGLEAYTGVSLPINVSGAAKTLGKQAVKQGIKRGVPKRGLSDTDTIRFTQDTIGSKFSDGRSVQGLIDGLKSGKVSPNDLPPIRTFQKDGLTYTLDNRRLFAAHQAGVKIKTVPATAKDVAKELPRKFTTRNQGTIIGIRGPLE